MLPDLDESTLPTLYSLDPRDHHTNGALPVSSPTEQLAELVQSDDDDPMDTDDDEDDEIMDELGMEEQIASKAWRTTCLVKITAKCHIELAGAKFEITCAEGNNDFFLELIDSADRQNTVLQVLFRFPFERLNVMEMFLSSYGRWRHRGKEFRCLNSLGQDTEAKLSGFKPAGYNSALEHSTHMCENCFENVVCSENSVPPFSWQIDHHYSSNGEQWLLEVDVFEGHFEIALNGVQVDRVAHRLPFCQIKVPNTPAALTKCAPEGARQKKRRLLRRPSI